MALPGFALFFMMLFVPTTYQPVKAVLLGIVLIMICATAVFRKKINLHPVVLLWTLFMVSVGLFFMLRGSIHGTPGALRVGTVYVLWPLVYTILVAGVSNEALLRGITRILVFSTIAIGIYSLSYILYASGLLPDYFYIPIDLGQAIGFYSGYIEYRLYNISSLLFLVPFLIAALLTWPNHLEIPVSRLWLWVAFALGMTLVLLSGRRALLLVIALAPVIALFFRLFLPRKTKLANRKLALRFFIAGCFALLGLIFYLQWVYGLNMQSLIQMFFDGFDFQRSDSAIARNMQFFALIDGWSQYPLLGAGHGAGVAYTRSVEQPWAYELSYVALLYQTGIIGFILYASGVLWIFWTGLQMIRSGHALGLQILPVLVGTGSFLIGNATNPYLGKYDYIWVIFLPVAFINLWLLHRKCKNRSTDWQNN